MKTSLIETDIMEIGDKTGQKYEYGYSGGF